MGEDPNFRSQTAPENQAMKRLPSNTLERPGVDPVMWTPRANNRRSPLLPIGTRSRWSPRQCAYRMLLEREMHIRMATFEVDPGKLEAVAEHFRVEAIRVFSAHEGFLGYQAFMDRDRGCMVGISRWRSLAELEASSESGRGIIRGAADLGAVVVGEPQILEQAFDVEPKRET